MNKKTEALRERLADKIHLEWCDWSLNISEKESLSQDRLDRWSKYWVEYSELPEDVKDYDRQWADQILKVLKAEGLEFTLRDKVSGWISSTPIKVD